MLVVSWRYEQNNRRAHFCMAGYAPYNVRICYSIHTVLKRPKSTFNSEMKSLSLTLTYQGRSYIYCILRNHRTPIPPGISQSN